MIFLSVLRSAAFAGISSLALLSIVPANAQQATQPPASAPPAPQCGGDFAAWKAALQTEAQTAGIGEKGLAALASAQPDPKVLERDRAQGVFAQTFAQFAGRMASDNRITLGKKNLEKYADIFARAEQQYGAPPPVIAAFWALETDFGAVQGNFHTLSALVTLAHDCRRPELFRKQLVPLLTLIDRGVLPADVEGAWAGEIGQTQILPIDYLEHGVDGDNDGVVDLRNDVADVIMTAGAKLKDRGWKPGQPWIEEVTLPENLPWDQTGRVNKLPISQWAQWGVTKRDGTPLAGDMKAGLLLPMGHKGPAFLAYENFDVYIEWNQSATYALTAGYLATRLAGAPALDLRDPVPGLSGDQMKELQTKLEAKGYDVGKVDGILGTNTREAVRKEQMRLGLVVDGWPTSELLSSL